MEENIYYLIRIITPSIYKISQNFLCGRNYELSLLINLLPTLDRIPINKIIKNNKQGICILLHGDNGCGKTLLITTFKLLIRRSISEYIFSIHLNNTDMNTPWYCIRILFKYIIEEEIKYNSRLGIDYKSCKIGIYNYFKLHFPDLIPYLACLNSICIYNYPETNLSKQLSSADRVEYTLTLLCYLFHYLLNNKYFIILIYHGEFMVNK
jgi:hypothetical protein